MQIPDQKLDDIILSMALARWQKVAMILAKSYEQLENDGAQIGFDRLAARIEFLVQAGRLDSQGDISQWRHSEVRLPVQGQ